MRWPILFISIFFISLASASVEINFQHNATSVGETIFATIETSGEILQEISKSDVKFFEGRKEVFFEFDLLFYEGVHYFYAYSSREGNFTLEISEILYRDSDGLKSGEILEEINISRNLLFDEDTNETYSEVLSIKPGYIFSLEVPSIKLSNLGDRPLNVSYSDLELGIPAGDFKEIEFSPSEVFSYLNISSYKKFSVPVIYFPANDSFYIPEDLNLKTNPSKILSNLILGEDTDQIIELFNFGDSNMENFTISSDLEFVEIEDFKTLVSRDSVNLTITFSPEELGYFKGDLRVSYFQNGVESSFRIPLNLFVLPEGGNLDDVKISGESCSELGGTTCGASEKCSNDPLFSGDGKLCCVGTCDSTDSSTSGKSSRGLIGFLIFVVIGIVGYIIYKKSKKTVQKNPEEKLKESSKKYTERISGKVERN